VPTTDESTDTQMAAPPIVDLETWQAARDELLVREKAHTRAGDAIAADRRRLPMTEVDAATVLDGVDGPVTLLDLFEGREELVVYKHMWHLGKPFENQCEGCTFTYWAVQDPAWLNARGVAFAVFAKGTQDELEPFRTFMGYPRHWYSVADVDDPIIGGDALDDFGIWTVFLRRDERVFLTYSSTDRGCEVTMPALALLDMTPRGRQEAWQEYPAGWPQGKAAAWFWRSHADGTGTGSTGSRPTIQWTRPGVMPVADGEPAPHCH
jgi:predicted dithiol-disulfide oxidoreductase (DUF899 family)